MLRGDKVVKDLQAVSDELEASEREFRPAKTIAAADSRWIYENPGAAAEEIDRLRAALSMVKECCSDPQIVAHVTKVLCG